MNAKTAARLARLKSSRTVRNWVDQDQGLGCRVGGRIVVDDDRFFEKITGGTGLLDWSQAKTYAASIVGEHRLCADLDFYIALEALIPDTVTWTQGWFKDNFGYWSSACIPWRDVARLAYAHAEASRGGEAP